MWELMLARWWWLGMRQAAGLGHELSHVGGHGKHSRQRPPVGAGPPLADIPAHL